MPEFTVTGVMGVSCYTTVEAETAEEAKEIAASREVANLCHMPFDMYIDEAWHFDNDGTPKEITVEG